MMSNPTFQCFGRQLSQYLRQVDRDAITVASSHLGRGGHVTAGANLLPKQREKLHFTEWFLVKFSGNVDNDQH